MITENNRALLRGELAELPVFSHENHGRRFDTFVLEVERLSRLHQYPYLGDAHDL